jgi:hypothetical protein
MGQPCEFQITEPRGGGSRPPSVWARAAPAAADGRRAFESEQSAGPRMARRLSLPAVTLSEQMGSNFVPIGPRPTGGRAGGDPPSRTSGPGASSGAERTRR